MNFIAHIILNEVNYLAVLLAALANFVIGALWYSPLLFSKKWAEVVFKNQSFEEAVKGSNMAFIFTMAFLAGFIQAFALAMFLHSGASAMIGGIFAGIIALFFLAVNLYKNSLFERRPFTYVLINGGHDIVVFVVMGMILGAMH